MFKPTFHGHKEGKVLADPTIHSIPVIPKGKIHFSSKHQKIYDPMEWNEFFDQKIMFEENTPIFISGTGGPILFCLHGLGLSAMSFAALAREMKDYLTLVTFDWRGHG